MTLPPGQRRALTILTHRAAHVIAPGHTLGRHDVSYTTAERLVVAGYARPVPPDDAGDLVGVMGALVITPAGRAILAQPVPEVPVFLHARDGLTTEASKAVRGEAEVIDPDTLSTWWTEQALQRRAQAEDRRAQARRLSRSTRAQRRKAA